MPHHNHSAGQVTIKPFSLLSIHSLSSSSPLPFIDAPSQAASQQSAIRNHKRNRNPLAHNETMKNYIKCLGKQGMTIWCWRWRRWEILYELITQINHRLATTCSELTVPSARHSPSTVHRQSTVQGGSWISRKQAGQLQSLIQWAHHGDSVLFNN